MSLTDAERAELEQLRAERDMRDMLLGTKAEFVSGMTSKGKPFQKIKVSGGPLGGWGVSLDPLQWEHLLGIGAYVMSVVDEHRDKFVNAK